jgi:hypothetical protein
MMTVPAPTHALRGALMAAIEQALGVSGVNPLLVPSRRPGVDLQANFAMKLAKQCRADWPSRWRARWATSTVWSVPSR